MSFITPAMPSMSGGRASDGSVASRCPSADKAAASGGKAVGGVVRARPRLASPGGAGRALDVEFRQLADQAFQDRAGIR